MTNPEELSSGTERVLDLEDRKQAEESLRERERDLSMIIETMPGLVWCAAPNGELNYVNQRILDYIGSDLQALAQAGWLNFLHPDDVQPTINAWSHAVETGEPHDVQYRLRRFDGTYRWFHVLGQPACDNTLQKSHKNAEYARVD